MKELTRELLNIILESQNSNLKKLVVQDGIKKKLLSSSAHPGGESFVSSHHRDVLLDCVHPYQHQPELLIKGRMDPCFHVLCTKFQSYLKVAAETESSHEVTFFQSSVVHFW